MSYTASMSMRNKILLFTLHSACVVHILNSHVFVDVVLLNHDCCQTWNWNQLGFNHVL